MVTCTFCVELSRSAGAPSIVRDTTTVNPLGPLVGGFPAPMGITVGIVFPPRTHRSPSSSRVPSWGPESTTGVFWKIAVLGTGSCSSLFDSHRLFRWRRSMSVVPSHAVAIRPRARGAAPSLERKSGLVGPVSVRTPPSYGEILPRSRDET